MNTTKTATPTPSSLLNIPSSLREEGVSGGTIGSPSYLSSLSPKELKAFHIAQSHLGTSFDLEKSVGYKAYMQQQQTTTAEPKTS